MSSLAQTTSRLGPGRGSRLLRRFHREVEFSKAVIGRRRHVVASGIGGIPGYVKCASSNGRTGKSGVMYMLQIRFE